jgi:hypothetical protein
MLRRDYHPASFYSCLGLIILKDKLIIGNHIISAKVTAEV